MSRQWSIEDEIKLFSLVCDYKPAGENKAQNMAQIIIHINENADGAKFTEEQVWQKLGQHYNLQRVEEIENENDDASESSEEEKTKTPRPERALPAVKRPRRKGDKEDTNETELYSLDLSDVECEEAELAKLQGEELLKKDAGRGRKKGKKAEVKEETPSGRKRTRANAKLGGTESAAKRRLLRASTPPTTTTKRRTRLEIVPDEEPEDAKEEEKEVRRSSRVRRSGRKK